MPKALGTRSERQEAGRFLVSAGVPTIIALKRKLRRIADPTTRDELINAATVAHSDTVTLVELQQLTQIRPTVQPPRRARRKQSQDRDNELAKRPS